MLDSMTLFPLKSGRKPTFPHTTITPLLVSSYQLRAILGYTYTLFLFTYIDFKTIFFPILAFASVCGPVHSMGHLLRTMLWVWLHLLQCNVSNQYRSSDEDNINRPWRPIPSGRITPEAAARLRWFLVPLCVGVSYCFGTDVAAISVALTITTTVYDELKLSGHWLGKNLCGVFGYGTFELGATKIIGKTADLNDVALKAFLYSISIIMTTLQAQDFPDVDGDRAMGRVTFPIYAPNFSRVFTFLAVVSWSVALGWTWELPGYAAAIFCAFGMYSGARYYVLRTIEDDKKSYKIYNLWLMGVHLLPLLSWC